MISCLIFSLFSIHELVRPALEMPLCEETLN